MGDFFEKTKQYEIKTASEDLQKEEKPKDKKTKLQDKLRGIAYTSQDEAFTGKLLYIANGLEFLDKYEQNTGKLYSYYLPEFFSLYNKCQELYKISKATYEEEELVEKKAELEEQLLLSASIVAKVVREKLEELLKQQRIGVDCDIQVLEGIVKGDCSSF